MCIAYTVAQLIYELFIFAGLEKRVAGKSFEQGEAAEADFQMMLCDRNSPDLNLGKLSLA